MRAKQQKVLQEKHDFPNGGWMLYSTDSLRRHKASAGGVVTEVSRYLLEKCIVRTALGFKYQEDTESFKPKWLYVAEEVTSVGSIYHEVPLLQFLRQTLHSVHPPVLVVALPCQIKAVRSIYEKAGIPVYIISLVCSGQLTIDATRELFRRVTQNKHVLRYQYRGEGWPSGVKITCSDGTEIFLENNHSIWTDIFHAAVYNLPRCFRCKDTFGIEADMTVGDPWLPRYVHNETSGVSMCIPHNHWAVLNLNKMLDDKRLALREVIPSWEVLESQRGTLEKKAVYLAHPKLISMLMRLYRQPWYMKAVFQKHIQVHMRFHRKCMKLLRHL